MKTASLMPSGDLTSTFVSITGDSVADAEPVAISEQLDVLLVRDSVPLVDSRYNAA